MRYDRPPWGAVIWVALEACSNRLWFHRFKTSRPRAQELLLLVREVRDDLEAEGSQLGTIVSSNAPHFRSAHLFRALADLGVGLVRRPAASAALFPLEVLRQNICEVLGDDYPERVSDYDLRKRLERGRSNRSVSP